VFDRLSGDETILEREPLAGLLADKQLMAYRHSGFWHRADTSEDKQFLESLWSRGDPPWMSKTKKSDTRTARSRVVSAKTA